MSWLPLVTVAVLLCYTSQVSAQSGDYTELARAFAEKQIEHLRKDVIRYFALHKEFESSIPNGSIKCREELDRMWELIKCILEMIDEMTEWRDNMLAQRVDPSDLVERLARWLKILFEKTAALADLANQIRKKFSDEQMERFDLLNENCIFRATEPVVDFLETIMMAELNTKEFIPTNWATPIPDICKKIWSMQNLCKSMIAAWKNIRIQLRDKCKLTGRNFPYAEMGQMLDCIIEFCKILREFRELCRLAASGNISAAELEKRLCELTMKLVDIRTKLLQYYKDLENVVFNTVKSLYGGTLAKRCRKILRSQLFSLLKELDACVREIVCWYQDIVEAGGIKPANPVEVIDGSIAA